MNSEQRKQLTLEQLTPIVNDICKTNFIDTKGNIQYPNEKQMSALLSISRGNNVAISGPPGTGKTYISNVADKMLQKLKPGINFIRTATTGLASTHLSSDEGEGKTYFRWLESGSESMIGHTPQFLNKLMTSPKCQVALKKPDVLQIDESSMLNVATMSHIENAARTARNNRNHMGGIQTILTGDIMQLGTIDVAQGGGHMRDEPPIAIPGILDSLPATYDVVILTDLMRAVDDPLHQEILKACVQQDPIVRIRAIEILNDICVDPNNEQFQATILAVKNSCQDGTTIVCYTNKQVDLYNNLEEIELRRLNPDGPINIGQARKLHSWNTLSKDTHKYFKDEEGLTREEDEIVKRRSFLPKLHLYTNQYCMLRRNSETYKNGQVVKFIKVINNNDGSKILEVIRRCDNKTLYIETITHTSEYVEDVGYEQFPIIPNAAITGHKVQGSTLDKVIFDPTSLSMAEKDIARIIYTIASRTRNIASFKMTARIPKDLISSKSVQDSLNNIWNLEYMTDYPKTTLEKLNAVYDLYKSKK